MSDTQRTFVLIAALVIIGGAIYYFESLKVRPAGRSSGIEAGEHDVVPRLVEDDALPTPPQTTSGQLAVPPPPVDKAGMYELAKEIVAPSGFINTDPLRIQDLIGKKVILVDFWTYSCINCQRTQPYLNAWYEKYRNQGLEIVGVHTPEFGFEKVYDNVLRATRDAGIQYPVVLDNDYETWSAYKNRFWPRKYLIDIDGYIVYNHIGEGAYAETEEKIQELLKERMAVLNERGSVASGVVRPEADTPNFDKPLSRETYFGALRNTNFGNGQPGVAGERMFALPAGEALGREQLYLGGTWDITPEYAKNISEGARIVFLFRAQDVHIVAGAPGGATLRVLQDGKPVTGGEVNDGILEIRESRRYHLIENSSFGEHTLEIYIESGTLEAFTFTFG